jgi:hypothetical protein
VFDPAKAEGNALIRISVGTLRFVTGDMPKGKTVIKTPTATLVLRGTDVTVYVHPDGTTDARVNDGVVDAHNDLTNEQTSIASGGGSTLGAGGNSPFNGSLGPTDVGGGTDGGTGLPEQRRGSGNPTATHSSPSHGSSGGGFNPGN